MWTFSFFNPGMSNGVISSPDCSFSVSLCAYICDSMWRYQVYSVAHIYELKYFIWGGDNFALFPFAAICLCKNTEYINFQLGPDI